jgi:hypothetical protein
VSDEIIDLNPSCPGFTGSLPYPLPRKVLAHIDPFGAADLVITCDERDPAAGGASHHYEVNVGGKIVAAVDFQHGPRGPDGKLTGCVDAALAAVLVDRLEAFQAGPFAHESNARALAHIRDALDIIRSRGTERKARGVLGVNAQ